MNWWRLVGVFLSGVLLSSCADSARNPAAERSAAIQSKAVVETPTLVQVKTRGVLNCGVNIALAGFSWSDDSGTWRGLDADFCRAVAAAVLGDSTKVEFKPVSVEQRFVALQSGDIDLLARNSVWTLSRDSILGLDFPAVTFYDGQGFMVRRDSGIRSGAQLKGSSVCVQQGTTTEFQLLKYSNAHRLGLQPVLFREADEALSAYEQGRCTAYTMDSSGLAAWRTALSDPTAHNILGTLISKEPVAPVVRQGDSQWSHIVRWTHFAMLIAEEKGIASTNVDSVRNSSADYEVRQLLGVDGSTSKGLGLARDWAYNIIKQVGNYAESFERNVGRATPLGIERGLNALWSDGGLQFAPPVR